MCVYELLSIEQLTGFGQLAPWKFCPGQFALASILSPDNSPRVNLPWDIHPDNPDPVQIIVFKTLASRGSSLECLLAQSENNSELGREVKLALVGRTNKFLICTQLA
jgi:hypothetical protein